MRREIGSEFWTKCTSEVPEGGSGMRAAAFAGCSVTETLSGRTALELVVEQLTAAGCKSVYMPSYCCHTMIEPFLAHGMELAFYDVVWTSSGLHRLFDCTNSHEVVFLMDYFGFIDEETAMLAADQKMKGKRLVYDATHSMYSAYSADAYDYIIGSYRKWADVNCGFMAVRGMAGEPNVALRVADEESYCRLRTEIFDRKADYISGRISDKSAFLDSIHEAEELLEQQYSHRGPDRRSLGVLEYADAGFVRRRRKENARFLTDALNALNHPDVRCMNAELSREAVPLFVPVYVSPEKRNDLRKYLIQHDIYCPIHWPLSEKHRISEQARKIYGSELSVICDQRYDSRDMERIVNEISTFLKV